MTTIGGGSKKVLYTLATVKRIGLLDSAKALKSNNTCKACGLGMGGQKGGMVNEIDEFPSVCNKSIQAQSTDIQKPIPNEVFQHSMTDFRQLSAKELETLGRLDTPVFKAKDQDYYKPINWDEALNLAAGRFNQIKPTNSFFYSSGRSSNEAGFILQLMARLYGTNNVNNCSYYCHQATGVGLGNSIGTGTATIELEDLSDCDCIFVIGANPSSNHPRFIHQLKKCRDRGGEVIVINPAKEPGLVRFAVPKSPSSMLKGGDYIASEYLQPNIGSDISLINGIAKSVIERNKTDQNFINNYTENFDSYSQSLGELSWTKIIQETGLSQKEIEDAASIYIKSKNVVFAWGMGITHHQHGVENVEAIANLALVRGMIGKQHAGLLPLRGHSNVQGIGTIGVKPVLAQTALEAIEQHLNVALPTEKGKDTLACLEVAYSGDIQAALIMGGNLYEASPHREWAKQAMDRIDFKLFLTTTLNKGHINGNDNSECLILPVSARDEEWQPTTQESMFNFVRLSDGGITRLKNVRPESNVLCDLGMRIVPKQKSIFKSFKQHDNVRDAIAATVPGMSNLKDISVAKKEFHVQNRVIHKPSFNTATKKAKFITHELIDKIQSSTYPFTLMSIRSEGQFNSIIYEENDSYRGTTERWSVLLNEEDLFDLGIKAGDNVDIVSDFGKMESVKTYSFDLPRGNIMAYYPEANVLIGLDRDPRSLTPSFKNVAVAIHPSQPSDVISFNDTGDSENSAALSKSH